MLVDKALHQIAILVVFLEKFERLGSAEDSLFVRLHILGWDFFELRDAVFHEAFVHQRIPEQDVRFACLDLTGVGLKVGVKFVDGGRVFFHLLEAIGFSENGLASVGAFGVFRQILVHELAALPVLFVERVAHPEPVGGGIGAGMVGVALQEISERLGGLHVFFGLQKREGPHETGLGSAVAGREILCELEVGGSGFFVSKQG